MLFRTFYLLRGKQNLVTRLLKPTLNYSNKYSCSYYNFSKHNLPTKIINKYDIIFNKCKFHTSPRRDIPPHLALLIRPLTRFGAFILGRILKKWWSRKTPKEKEMYKKWFFARKTKFYGALGFGLAGLLIFYISHIEKDPLTGRLRFIILNKEQQKLLSSLVVDNQLEIYENSVLPPTHPQYRRLSNIVQKLLKANADISSIAEKEWSVTVINSTNTNAFVLPGGAIFVCSGMLNLVENDHQLAFVLAHEIAHVLLLHSIESLSRNFLLDILLAVPIGIIWFIIPSDLIAFALQLIGVNLANVLITFPKDRTSEKEADTIGLKMASRACFDVREAVVFWTMMQHLTEMQNELELSKWLSTHPTFPEREKYINDALPNAIDLRNKSGCKALSKRDPVAVYRAKTKEQHFRNFSDKGLLLNYKK